MPQPPKKKTEETLGRLKSLGLSELWQVALLLPLGWDDLTNPIEGFDREFESGGSYLLRGKLTSEPTMKFGNGAPRLIGQIVDQRNRRIGWSVFGDSREFLIDLKGNEQDLLLYGQIDAFNGGYWLKSPEIVDAKWVGRFRPRYQGKPKVINADTVRDRVVRNLKTAIPLAAEHLANSLQSYGNRERLAELAGLPGCTLEQIITQAHVPRTLGAGKMAQWAMDLLAAYGIIESARGSHSDIPMTHPLMIGDWRERAAAIPFSLTDEQGQAITETLADIALPTPMRRVLSGDVGTGKTAVYGTVAATVVDAFGTVAVLLPNEGLAQQVSRECAEWWPDLPQQLVTGSTVGEVVAPLVIGTTALLFRTDQVFSLVIVDEQQKASREQREQLVSEETHLLEVTATAIPRSAALCRYGIIKVSKLTKNHTPKTIHTKVYSRNQWGEISTGIKETIAAGGQVLYVYPLREKNEKPEVDDDEEEQPASKRPELKSATEVFEKWEVLYPGKARLIHGQMSSEEKKASLEAMRSGAASVLIATTVVEVGISLPLLRRVVIVNCGQFGLSTLHQIRGRVARLGGEGWCDLFLPFPVKESTMDRLRVLERTQDGFEVAEADMRLRGVGDMSRNSSKQSGADMTFLFGRPVSIDALDAVLKIMAQQP